MPLPTEIYPWLKNTIPLSPHSFAWDEHEIDNSFLLNNKKSLPHNWKVLGWADAEQIPHLPKKNSLVILLENENKRFWIHMFKLVVLVLFFSI